MKTLKLLIIFLVLVGGLILALNWRLILTSDTSDDNFGDEDLIDIGAKCEEVRNAWGRCTEWDQDLYSVQREDIDQSKSMGMFSREGYNTVNNALRESATNKACESYLTCLHDTLFNASKLQKQYDGIQFLTKQEKLGNDQRVKEVEERHELYTQINQFVQSRHTISPRFEAESADWVSFSAHQNYILAKARQYRQHQLYRKEMSHISDFQKGLDESNLKTSTNKQRSRFYNDLCEQIIDYFEQDIPSQEKAELLNSIYNKFSNQESGYGLDKLAAFVVSYRDKLKSNEQTVE